MTNNSLIYSFKITCLERKRIAVIIADEFLANVEYQGPPSFAYRTAGWTIDRNSVVSSPEIEDNKILQIVPNVLKNAGAMAEGDAKVTLSMNGYNGNTLRNLVNLLWCKQCY